MVQTSDAAVVPINSANGVARLVDCWVYPYEPGNFVQRRRISEIYILQQT